MAVWGSKPRGTGFEKVHIVQIHVADATRGVSLGGDLYGLSVWFVGEIA